MYVLQLASSTCPLTQISYLKQVHEPCIVEFLEQINHDRTPMKGVGGWERTCIVACVFTPIRTLHGSRSWDTQHLYRALESEHDFGIKHDTFVVITVIVTGREDTTYSAFRCTRDVQTPIPYDAGSLTFFAAPHAWGSCWASTSPEHEPRLSQDPTRYPAVPNPLTSGGFLLLGSLHLDLAFDALLPPLRFHLLVAQEVAEVLDKVAFGCMEPASGLAEQKRI